MTHRRRVTQELQVGGCTPDEIELFLLVERISRRRERTRRAERFVRTLGAALVRWAARPVAVRLPTR